MLHPLSPPPAFTAALEIPQEEAQLPTTLRKTWDNLAGIIRRRVIGVKNIDGFVAKAKESLFCALMGTSKKNFYASGSRLSFAEMKTLLSVYEDLIKTIKGNPGDPGLASEFLDNEISLRLVFLKQQRGTILPKTDLSKTESPTTTDKKEDDRNTRHCLPPVGTLVWYGDIPFEVVSAARLRVPAKGSLVLRPYRPRNGRALLCLKGVRTGAFNAAPTALTMAIDGKNRSGWLTMRFSPSRQRFGTGLISEIAEKVLGSGKAYLCAPKSDDSGNVYPNPVPELQVLTENYDMFGLVADEIPLGEYKEAPPKETPVKEAPSVSVSVPPANDKTSVSAGLTDLLSQMRKLKPMIEQYERLREQFRRELSKEQTRLFVEWQARKMTMAVLTQKLEELAMLQQEF